MKKAKKHGVANNKNALKDIDPEDVRKLSEKFWPKSEIAAFLGCHVDTITNRFQEIYLKGRENGKSKLRDIQLCFGMELDPIYIDVILKRYKKLYPDAVFKCLNRKFDFGKLFKEI